MDSYFLIGLEIVLLIVLICGSAFFSSCEMSLFSLSRAKVIAYKNDPSPTKRRIYFLLDNYNRTLVSIILSNMFVNSCISMLNDTVIKDTGLSGAAATAASAVTGILVLLLFGEITPMTLAYVYCDFWSRVVALPVCMMRKILFPVIYVAEKFSDKVLDLLGRRNSVPLTHEEYDSYIDTCTRNGAFSPEEKTLLKEALDFSSRELTRIMQARTSVGFLRKDAPAESVAEAIYKVRKMYFVVGEKDLDDADMILSAREFFMLSPQQREHWLNSPCVRTAIYIPEQTSVVLALRTLKAHNEFAALISDEYGGISGLISRSGIYAALTGSSIGGERSAPTEPLRQDADGKLWLYEGLTPVEAVIEDTGWSPEEELKSSTLNGAFCELYGALPKVGAEVTDSGIRIRVLEMTGNRASKLEVTLLQDPERKTGMEEKEESHSC